MEIINLGGWEKWEIQAESSTHIIEYKQGFGKKIIVDGVIHKVKSSNPIIDVIDYKIPFDDTDCKLVVLGNKADLAVNGTFLESKKPYEAMNGVPSWVWMFVGISILGGFLVSGIFSLLIGVLMSLFYIQYGLEKKKSHVVSFFKACCVIQLATGFGVASLLF